jgi:hypothetical protein
MAAATTSVNGYLTSTDWNTFNGKQPAGSYLVSGGALGTPSSGTVTNLTGTASININGTVGATTANTGAFTTLTASTSISTGTGSTTTAGLKFLNGSAGVASGFGTIYPENVTSSFSTTYSFFAKSDGTYSGINGTTKSELQVNANVIATATSTGLAVTGVLSATGVVTFSNYGAGAATFNGSGVISSVSDETWKVKDGAPVDPDAMLKQLEPGYWFYNDDKKEIFGKDRQLGFYAQNVNAAIGPEAAPEPESYISQDEDGNEITVKKPWGYYDRSVLAVTVMSLQKALATIETLTARITALETK